MSAEPPPLVWPHAWRPAELSPYRCHFCKRPVAAIHIACATCWPEGHTPETETP